MKSLLHEITSKSNQYNEVNKVDELSDRSWYSAIHRFNQSVAPKNFTELFRQNDKSTLSEKYDIESDKKSDSNTDLSDVTFTSAIAAAVRDGKASLLWTESLRLAEEQWHKLSGICQLQQTAHPTIFCSTLPRHWRSNKSLPTPFVVLALHPITDGTRVTVSAGNDENPTADVKNCTAEFGAQMARFVDLRFVGKSGRGKNFNLTITIYSKPVNEVAIVNNAIKVTVDGPRDSRNTNKNATNLQNQSTASRKRPCSSSSVNGIYAANFAPSMVQQTPQFLNENDDVHHNKSKKINNNGGMTKRNVVEKTIEKFNDRLPTLQWRRRRAAKRTRLALRTDNVKQNDSLALDETVQPYGIQSSYNSMLATATLSAALRQQSQSQQCRQFLREQIAATLTELNKKSKYNAQNNSSSLTEQNNSLLSLQKNATTSIMPTFGMSESASQQQQQQRALMQILTTALKDPNATILRPDQQETYSTANDSSLTAESLLIYQAILQQQHLQNYCKQSYSNTMLQQSLSHESNPSICENNETNELLMNSATPCEVTINDVLTSCSGVTTQKYTPASLCTQLIKSKGNISKNSDFHLMKHHNESIMSPSDAELKDECATTRNNSWLEALFTEKVHQGRSISPASSVSTSKRTKNYSEKCDSNNSKLFTNLDTTQKNNSQNRQSINANNLKSCTKTSSHLWRPFELSDDLDTVKQYIQY